MYIAAALRFVMLRNKYEKFTILASGRYTNTISTLKIVVII
jgi:hypothetical protein